MNMKVMHGFFFENLTDYELADWFHDFIINQNTAKSEPEDKHEEKISSKEALKPFITPIKTSVDKMLGKK